MYPRKGNWICSRKSQNRINTPYVLVDLKAHTPFLYLFLIFFTKAMHFMCVNSQLATYNSLVNISIKYSCSQEDHLNIP